MKNVEKVSPAKMAGNRSLDHKDATNPDTVRRLLLLHGGGGMTPPVHDLASRFLGQKETCRIICLGLIGSAG